MSKHITPEKKKSNQAMSAMEAKKKKNYHRCSMCGQEYYGGPTFYRLYENGIVIKELDKVEICSICVAVSCKNVGVFAYPAD